MKLPVELDAPLSEHALSHVLSDLLSNYVETDEDEMRQELTDAGYRATEIVQIMRAWAKELESRPRCSTCGQPAQALWISITEEGEMSSQAGRGRMTPSCFQCGDAKVAFEGGVTEAQVFAPLGWDPETLMFHRTALGPKEMADIVLSAVGSDPRHGEEMGEALGLNDETEWVVALVRGFARVSAARGFADSFDATLVKVLVDATA